MQSFEDLLPGVRAHLRQWTRGDVDKLGDAVTQAWYLYHLHPYTDARRLAWHAWSRHRRGQELPGLGIGMGHIRPPKGMQLHAGMARRREPSPLETLVIRESVDAVHACAVDGTDHKIVSEALGTGKRGRKLARSVGISPRTLYRRILALRKLTWNHLHPREEVGNDR